MTSLLFTRNKKRYNYLGLGRIFQSASPMVGYCVCHAESLHENHSARIRFAHRCGHPNRFGVYFPALEVRCHESNTCDVTRYTLQGRGAKRYFFEVYRITISLTNSFQRRIKQLRPYDSHTSDHITLSSLISARFYALIPPTFKKSRFEKNNPNHGQNRVQIRVPEPPYPVR